MPDYVREDVESIPAGHVLTKVGGAGGFVAFQAPSGGGGGGVTDGDKGDVVVSGGGTVWTVDNDAITYAKMQNISAASRLLGRGAGAGAGDPQEISLGENLLMTGTVLSGFGVGSAITIEVNLGSAPIFTGKFTITDAAISGTSKVLCWQAPGPYTGKGTRADEAELQPVQIISIEPASGTAVVKWQTPPVYGPILFPSAGGQPTSGQVPGLKDMSAVSGLVAMRRLGRIRGNVKFNYLVF